MANRKAPARRTLSARDIRAARLRTGLGQKNFGRAYFDVDGATVCRWETKGPPKRGVTRRLLDLVIPPLLAKGPAPAELAR
jgi:DNA-binding transcriptional regulator YiaG